MAKTSTAQELINESTTAQDLIDKPLSSKETKSAERKATWENVKGKVMTSANVSRGIVKYATSGFNPGKVSKAQVKAVQTFRPVGLSPGQKMIDELFNGERTFGTGRNLPVMHRSLISGGGIIKSGDIRRETGGMFGLR
jgi:hypothetical protein